MLSKVVVARLIGTVFLCCAGWVGLMGQLDLPARPAQLNFRNYGTAEGLPSSETYTLLEDSRGYIWVGTDNGVARYDGYEFRTYDADDGLDDTVVFAIIEDDQGRIWASSYSGRVFYFEDERFHPYLHNEVARKLRANRDLVILNDVLPDGEVILRIRNYGLVRIDTQGIVRHLISPTEDRDNTLYIYHPLDGRQPSWKVRNHSMHARNGKRDKENFHINYGNGDEWRSLPALPQKLIGLFDMFSVGIVLDHEDKRRIVVVSQSSTTVLDTLGRVLMRIPFGGRRVNYLMAAPEPDAYFVMVDRGLGLQWFGPGQNGSDQPERRQYLKGHSLTASITDRRGGIWVASADAGIFYCPYPKQRVFDTQKVASRRKSVSLALTNDGGYYVGYDDGSVFRYHAGADTVFDVRKVPDRIVTRVSDLYFDDANQRLYSLRGSFQHRPYAHGWLTDDIITAYKITGKKVSAYDFSVYPQTDPGVLYIAGNHYISRVNMTSTPEPIAGWAGNGQIAQMQCYGLTPEGTEVLGTIRGLARVVDGSPLSYDVGVPALNEERIVSLTETPLNARLYATRGRGIIYHSPDTTYFITAADGLASNMIRDVHAAGDGRFYVGTLNGLTRLELAPDERSYQIRTMRAGHGLPDNEIHRVDTDGEEVWLATGSGIVHFTEPPLDSVSPAPTIRSVQVNGKVMPVSALAGLRPGPHDLSISFGSINFVLNGEVRYRYRLSGSSEWFYTYARTANFPNLARGEYHFVVQAENQDGIWSAPVRVDISIATPWYQTWWALIGLMATIAAVVSGIFLLRERRQQREQALLTQINQLEHAALHAQMNPHFVFNALNSIQNFVLQNDARQAATYLSRFASIIRQTLRSSVNGKHSLAAELEMLSTYLVLEKLRFKEGFVYQIDVAEHLDRAAIQLPPLLIQPFVENAIIHGLKGKTAAGRILINFAGTARELVVTVEDNGRGYERREGVGRESMGMDITRKRLEMMNTSVSDHPGMEIERLYADDGTAAGTRITLIIQLTSDRTFAPKT